MPKAAEALFQQLDKALQGPKGVEIQGKTKVRPVQAVRRVASARLGPAALAQSMPCGQALNWQSCPALLQRPGWVDQATRVKGERNAAACAGAHSV